MKNKNTIMLVVAIILVAAGLIWIRLENQKISQNQNEKKSNPSEYGSVRGGAENELSDDELEYLEEVDQDFEIKCQNGEAVKIADLQGSSLALTGKLRKVYSDDEISPELKNFSFYVEARENTPISGADLSKLENFEDREVEIQGAKSQDGKSIEVSQIKCAGIESDKTAIDARTKILNWIGENISSVGPQKAPYQKWTVDTVDFVDDRNIYIEYYDAAEDSENYNVDVDTSRKALLEMSAKEDGGYNAKVLAYWEMGDDDYILKSGADKFEDVTDTMMYQYDPEEKSWTRI